MIKSIWWRLRDWAVGPGGWLIGDATPAEQRDLSRLDRLDGLTIDLSEVELDEMERAAMEVDEDTDRIFSTGTVICELCEADDTEHYAHEWTPVFVDDGLGDEFEAELDQWERRRD